jgi:hypothetical protein
MGRAARKRSDTNALPQQLAQSLGLSPSDLDAVVTAEVGGQTTVPQPKTGPAVEIEIAGRWYALPNVQFCATPAPLLGRDLIFREFYLRMEHGETDLRPKS